MASRSISVNKLYMTSKERTQIKMEGKNQAEETRKKIHSNISYEINKENTHRISSATRIEKSVP